MTDVHKLYENLSDEDKAALEALILKKITSRAGSTKSKAKSSAARENGKLGGRPARVSIPIEPKFLTFKGISIPCYENFFHAARTLEALGYAVDPKKGFSSDSRFEPFFPPISRRYFTYKDPSKARHSNAVIFLDFEYIEKYIMKKLANPLSKPPEAWAGKREKFLNNCYALRDAMKGVLKEK